MDGLSTCTNRHNVRLSCRSIQDSDTYLVTAWRRVEELQVPSSEADKVRVMLGSVLCRGLYCDL